MGIAGALVGGAVLGLLAGKGNSSSSDNSYLNSSQIAYQNAVQSIPTAPEAPTNPDTGQKSDDILKAEEEERKKRLAEQEANKTNFSSSGLGVTGSANINRKTLLGAA